MLADDDLLGNSNNFSYVFNSDGLPVVKSSQYSKSDTAADKDWTAAFVGQRIYPV